MNTRTVNTNNFKRQIKEHFNTEARHRVCGSLAVLKNTHWCMSCTVSCSLIGLLSLWHIRRFHSLIYRKQYDNLLIFQTTCVSIKRNWSIPKINIKFPIDTTNECKSHLWKPKTVLVCPFSLYDVHLPLYKVHLSLCAVQTPSYFIIKYGTSKGIDKVLNPPKL